MPIRITGMNSGLDTEAIIKELASAKSYKKTKMEKAQTKLGWKQEAWKALNTKIYNFYTQTLDDMRFSTAYSKKKVTCSNSNAVSIVATEDAPYSTQTLDINEIAKSGYMTGGEVSYSGAKGSTTMGDLLGAGFSGASFDVTIGNETPPNTTTIALTASTTIDDVVSQLRAAGVNANFDEKNQRFYISSKDTGSANDFKFSGDAAGEEALAALGLWKDATLSDGTAVTNQAHYEAAKDAEIVLNGVKYTSSSNVFEINGLTITANEKASGMTITTQSDTSGIFDIVKNFFKGYNELINEMDKLYNADSSKGYEPLTDEEKDALSDTEVEKWEKKIKDAVLRKDSTLSGVASAMKEVMSKGVTMSDGSQLYLFDFGIETLGYFNAPDNEKNAYHIDGDADDANTSRNDNKLLAAIAANPDGVAEFFTGLANNLHDVLFDKMKGIDGVSSTFCVYEDKLLQEEYDDYTEKIAQQQKKVDAFMDRYYAKFSAMETALARMESKSNAVSQLLGM